MTIVDTTVWIDFLNGKSNPEVEWLDRKLTRQRWAWRIRLGIKGFRDLQHGRSGARDPNRSKLLLLRGRGRTVRKAIDCLIATFCLIHGHSLVHRDRDYQPSEDVLGLHVIHA